MIDTLLIRASKSSVTCITSLACLAFSMTVNPALAAPTPTQLVEAITSAKVLPASVSMNARYSMGEVQLYMYRSSRVPDADLKIDSVLVTKALRDKFGDDIKSVQLNFYDKDNKVLIRQCTVNQTHVNSFASKQISQQQLLDMLTIARMNAGGASGSGSSGMSASKQAILNANCVEGLEKRRREGVLSSIKDLVEKGGDYRKVWDMFKRMESLASSGQYDNFALAYNEIQTEIMLEDAKTRQKISSAMQAAQNRRLQANAQAEILSYNPPWGFGFARRRAIWAQIVNLSNKGNDVSSYLVQLKDTVDKPLSQGNTEAVKAGVIRMEQQLGLPGSYNW